MKDTTSIGAAAAHLVCADLLLSGHRAFLAPEGHHYDVLVDIGNILKIQVKGTRRACPRPSRRQSPAIYNFHTDRNHRPAKIGGKSALRNYDNSHVDLIACVALDIRVVAYFPVKERFISAVHLYPPGSKMWLRNGVEQRRLIDAFPFQKALINLAK